MKASPPPATCKDSSPTNKIRHMDSKYVYAWWKSMFSKYLLAMQQYLVCAWFGTILRKKLLQRLTTLLLPLAPPVQIHGCCYLRWKTTKQLSGASTLTFTVTKPLLKVTKHPGRKVTSTLLKCDSPRASGPLCGWKGFLMLLPLWTMRGQGNGKKLSSLVNVQYLFQLGELEDGVKRATDST